MHALKIPMSLREGLILALLLCCILEGRSQTGHAHLNAGAITPDAGSQLYFVNGDRYLTNSGYVVNMTHDTSGQYAGYFQGTITLTAQPSTRPNGGPAFGHSAPGSFLQCEVVSVSGPPGSKFGFWEEEDTQPRFEIVVGQPPAAPPLFPLSESSGLPGTDPFGHIHGRRLTTTLPGLHTLALRIVDTSTNGPNAGPLHTPSYLAYLHFQAGITLHSLQINESTLLLQFGGWPDTIFQIETTTQLNAPDSWTPVGDPVDGTQEILSIEIPKTNDPVRFYRIQAEPL